MESLRALPILSFLFLSFFSDSILFDNVIEPLEEARVAVITLEDLRVAFRKAFEESGISEDQLDEWADTIISLFGFDYSVVDNRLTPKDRDIFYKLEEAGLVFTKQEEVTLSKGKVWRLHYWFLNRKRILKLSRGEDEPDEEGDAYSVYDVTDDDLWSRQTKT